MARRSGIRVWQRLGPGSGLSMPIEEVGPISQCLIFLNGFLSVFIRSSRGKVGTLEALWGLIGLVLLPVAAVCIFAAVFTPRIAAALSRAGAAIASRRRGLPPPTDAQPQ
jgi:hypothetical protein